jgi:hypothetical protein
MTSESIDNCSAALGHPRAQQLTELFHHARHDLSRIAAFATMVAEYYAAANDQQRAQAAPFT